ncbi:MAG: hypothetical protein DI498_08525 [Paracoccus denitrificans]|nr:MAG: hypothetical protein DI498_08525 [Paracoccus denitrificans]PZO84309.1 MAG: hypothetical protein DI633_08525 [Paracoccus denitrificans]
MTLEGDSCIRVEVVRGLGPFDGQFGAQTKRSVPDSLRDVLFGANDGADTHVYALLDAARVSILPGLIERNRLPAVCLFKGDALDDLSAVAPWLIKLEEDSQLTRGLFTAGRAPWHLWDSQPGIILQSGADIDEIAAHLRHFTRIQDEDGAWFYFRFWEPSVAAAYFPGLADRPDLAARWFHPRRGAPIDAIIAVEVGLTDATATIIRPGMAPDATGVVVKRFLDKSDMERLAAKRLASDTSALAADLRKTFGSEIKLTDPELHDLTQGALRRLLSLGFRQRDNLFVMLAWEAFFGPRFEEIDPDGKLSRILRSDRDEAERFVMMKDRMDELG